MLNSSVLMSVNKCTFKKLYTSVFPNDSFSEDMYLEITAAAVVAPCGDLKSLSVHR